MALRERRLPRTQQPQDGAKLDLKNPLTRGVLFAYDFAGRSIGGTNYPVTYASGYSRRVGSQGIAIESNVANAGFLITLPDIALDEFSLVIVADLPSRSAPAGLNIIVGGDDTYMGVHNYLYGGGQNLTNRIYYAPDYSGIITADMPESVPVSGKCVIIQTYRRGAFLRGYVNGVLRNSATPANNQARISGAATGNTYKVNQTSAQTIGVQCFWLIPSAYTEQEAADVGTNPWQAFEPQRIWVPVSAGGGTAVKVWNGSAWVAKTVKVWNGSAWQAKTVKVWNGSSWV